VGGMPNWVEIIDLPPPSSPRVGAGTSGVDALIRERREGR
jgi:hypothetical protein